MQTHSHTPGTNLYRYWCKVFFGISSFWQAEYFLAFFCLRVYVFCFLRMCFFLKYHSRTRERIRHLVRQRAVQRYVQDET